jgi:DNA-binding transcriptional ArsR family regulator
MKGISDIGDPRLVKALAHPLRVRILGILESRVASPSEISDEIGVPLGNVAYHVRMLADFGLVKLVRRTPRRGAVEHHYRAVGRLRITDQVWAQVPDVVKEAMVGATLQQIADYVNAAASKGGFDTGDAHATRTPMVLDAAGFKELSREVMRLYDRARDIQAESAERLKSADHDGELAAGLVLMLFEGADFGVDGEPTPARPRSGARGRARVARSATR